MKIKIKLTLVSPSGSIESQYADVRETPGGYASLRDVANAIPDEWLLGHDDRITYERLDQVEDDELTAEDERQLGRR